MSVIRSIPYVLNSDTPNAHSFDIHLPPNPASAPPLICFVHGGAWRSEDKEEHAALATALAALTAFPVVVPNYRLSPKTPAHGPPLLHPDHSADILRFLNFALAWEGPEGTGRPYDPERIVLIGHSCSAHMLSSIFLDSASATPSLTPSPELLSAVKAVVCSEGVYDLDALLADFPGYKAYFVAGAFGPGPSYEAFNVAKYPLRAGHIKWLIIHSRGDTLINQRQSDLMITHLNGLYSPARQSAVSHNLTELDEEHDPLLYGSVYPKIVAKYIAELFKPSGSVQQPRCPALPLL